MITIAGLLALLVLILAVPLQIAFRLRGMDEFGGQVTIHWLYGLLRFRIPVPDPRQAAATAIGR